MNSAMVSKVFQSRPGSSSVRATIPQGIVEGLRIAPGDSLKWSMKIEDRRIIAQVEMATNEVEVKQIDNVIIRFLKNTELKILEALYNETIPDIGIHPARIFSKEKVVKYYKEYPFLFNGAFRNNEMIGFIIAWPDGGLVVHGIGVKEEYRRKGIGSGLLSVLDVAAYSYGFTGYALGAVWEAVPFYLANDLSCFANININPDEFDLEHIKNLQTEYNIRGMHVFDSQVDEDYISGLIEAFDFRVTPVVADYRVISIQVIPDEISKASELKIQKDFKGINVQFAFQRKFE